jgi:hypothetical protein
MERKTQVPESPRSPSNPMDLNLLQDVVHPSWMPETLDKSASLIEASKCSKKPLE